MKLSGVKYHHLHSGINRAIARLKLTVDHTDPPTVDDIVNIMWDYADRDAIARVSQFIGSDKSMPPSMVVELDASYFDVPGFEDSAGRVNATLRNVIISSTATGTAPIMPVRDAVFMDKTLARAAPRVVNYIKAHATLALQSRLMHKVLDLHREFEDMVQYRAYFPGVVQLYVLGGADEKTIAPIREFRRPTNALGLPVATRKVLTYVSELLAVAALLPDTVDAPAPAYSVDGGSYISSFGDIFVSTSTGFGDLRVRA